VLSSGDRIRQKLSKNSQFIAPFLRMSKFQTSGKSDSDNALLTIKVHKTMKEASGHMLAFLTYARRFKITSGDDYDAFLDSLVLF